MTTLMHPTAVCELLPWDSEFFHCRIGKLRGDTLNEADAREIEEWRRSERIHGLYFLARASCPVTIQTAANHGFELVDIRVTLECSVPNPRDLSNTQLPPKPDIRAARSEDLPALQAIARTAHRDSRFFSDPHFPRHKAEALYSTWIGLEYGGRAQRVWVAASSADEALGYLSCHLDSTNQAGQIGLMGIDSRARGKGLGKSLVLTALQWFASHGGKEVTVVTQGKNIAAQRLYQRCGFVIRDLQLWYHKWYSPPVIQNA